MELRIAAAICGVNAISGRVQPVVPQPDETHECVFEHKSHQWKGSIGQRPLHFICLIVLVGHPCAEWVSPWSERLKPVTHRE